MSAANIITKFRIEINDTTVTYKYSDQLLTLIIQNSIDIIYGINVYTVENIPEEYYTQFRLLSLSYFYKYIAQNVAYYFDFKEGISGDEIKKEIVFNHYMDLSKQFYNEYIEQVGITVINNVSGVLI